MDKIKTDRINSELQKQITAIIANEIKDPRLCGAIIGVTKANVTPDLKFAKVFLSVYANDEESKKSAFDTVVRSSMFIRAKLKETMKIRLVPEIHFVIDNSFEYGAKIDNLLSQITIPPAEK
ncbi:MAG: 30S ribosome-binding factor RbfA [Clostridia bacterium]|nr:30S ribosome-binding factor RbfA [Clostridia bacterium]